MGGKNFSAAYDLGWWVLAGRLFVQANPVALGVDEMRDVALRRNSRLGQDDLTTCCFDAAEHCIKLTVRVQVNDDPAVPGM